MADVPEGQTPPAAERRDFLRGRFRGWYAPIEHLIDATAADTILETPIYDIEPLERWSQGRITLLGDAAPDMAQGACMAIEDAVVLARCLAQADDVPAALDRYETERKPRTTWVMEQSRVVGRIANLQTPLLSALRDFMLTVIGRRIGMKQFEKALIYEA